MFIPGSTDPNALDRSMRHSLAESLAYIVSEMRGRLDLTGFDEAPFLERIRKGRINPGAFGRYYKLVLALEDENDVAARSIFGELASLVQRPAPFRAVRFDRSELGLEFELYRDIIDANPVALPWMVPPGDSPQFPSELTKALDLIRQADAHLAGELEGLLIHVVGAAPSKGPEARPFGSASSFMLWGAIFVNLERYPTALDLVYALVHETAHLLLFAHSIAGPLVTNPVEERYLSPLRKDPRPMDGVYHATFVAARLHYLSEKLVPALSAADRPKDAQEIQEKSFMMRELYLGGLQTVSEHGKLTEAGTRILAETQAFMQLS